MRWSQSTVLIFSQVNSAHRHFCNRDKDVPLCSTRKWIQQVCQKLQLRRNNKKKRRSLQPYTLRSCSCSRAYPHRMLDHLQEWITLISLYQRSFLNIRLEARHSSIKLRKNPVKTWWALEVRRDKDQRTCRQVSRLAKIKNHSPKRQISLANILNEIKTQSSSSRELNPVTSQGDQLINLTPIRSSTA